MYRVRWGRLLHERFNNTDADDLFNEAIKLDPKNAQAYLGLALVSADGFDDKAIDYGLKALELDPKLVEAHELMARLFAGRFGHEAGDRRRRTRPFKFLPMRWTRWRFTPPSKFLPTVRPIRGSRKFAR